MAGIELACSQLRMEEVTLGQFLPGQCSPSFELGQSEAEQSYFLLSEFASSSSSGPTTRALLLLSSRQLLSACRIALHLTPVLAVKLWKMR
mmetsp:Transcript_71401/g.155542  ORF Transcript_71401/g.155542 Transcript_71401/m.155542 type:complete len:91 (+) Transcript_71401:74-346(+)